MPGSFSLVLHLGAHKTGTSLLQKYMLDRPDELARMRMVAIRRSASNDLIGWGAIPQEQPELLREAVLAAGTTPVVARRKSRLARTFASPGRPPRTVVVSHENSLGRPVVPAAPSLYPRAGKCAEGLARSVGELEPRVVYYLRSQESFLESYYLQTVHQGGTADFTTWISQFDLESVSWAPLAETLAATFGAENFVLRDFAEIRAGQNAFIEAFLRTCDPTLQPEVDYDRLRNISISQRGLELALAMNPLLQTPEERHNARGFLQRNFNNTTGSRPVLFSEEAKAELRERYQAENLALLERFGPARPPAEPAP